MTRCTNKPLLWVLEELTGVAAIGGLSGPLRKVEYFLCLVTRLLQICPPPAILEAMLRQEWHKYVRVAALLVIRLIGHPSMMNEAVRVGIDDYRKVRMYGDPEENAAPPPGAASDQKTKDPRMDGRSGPPTESPTMTIRTAQYFIMRMDELTVQLFHVEGSPERPFVGLSLPPLVDPPTVSKLWLLSSAAEKAET